METALSTLTPQQQAKLERDRSRASNQYPTIPQIRLANKDMTQAPEGEYFIEVRKKDEESEIRDIGKNPEIVILYKTVTYSYYDDVNKELVAWTSDIHGYGDSPVTLFLKVKGKVTIDFDGTYNEFKKYRTKFDIIDPISGDKKGSNLTFKNVLYVLFEGKIHKMFVSNASAVGMQPDGKPSFDKCQKNSMQYFTDMCWNDQKALYDFAVTMGAKLVRKHDDGEAVEAGAINAKVPKPFYLMQFESVRPLQGEELSKAIDASIQTENAIRTIDAARKNSVTEEQHKVTVAEATEVFGEDNSTALDTL